jgi:adenosylcobinamide-phosphate synthase
MDSMLGYRNERYMYFGTAAAKLDDILNYIPSRVCAVFMICASWVLKLDYRNALKIFLRDRYNHKSPNSAQTESVCAGALGVRLAGNAYYFGKLYEKPYIGDALREIECEDIIRANKLMFTTQFLIFLFLTAIVLVAGAIY